MDSTYNLMPLTPKEMEESYKRMQRLEKLKDKVPKYLQSDFYIGLVEPEELERIVSKN